MISYQVLQNAQNPQKWSFVRFWKTYCLILISEQAQSKFECRQATQLRNLIHRRSHSTTRYRGSFIQIFSRHFSVSYHLTLHMPTKISNYFPYPKKILKLLIVGRAKSVYNNWFLTVWIEYRVISIRFARCLYYTEYRVELDKRSQQFLGLASYTWVLWFYVQLTTQNYTSHSKLTSLASL